MLRCFKVLCPLLFVMSAALSARADTVFYSFEPPQFANLETTPLLNRAPNSGSAAFLASFTSATPGSFQIANFQPNILFQGQSLVNPSTADVLTISFNMPVTQVEFSWAIIEPGRLDLTSPVGNASQNSAVVQPGTFQGGIFVFSSAAPFTTFSLAAFNNFFAAGSPVPFAIDSLTVTFTPQQTPTPEPATVLLLGTGLACAVGAVRRRRTA